MTTFPRRAAIAVEGQATVGPSDAHPLESGALPWRASLGELPVLVVEDDAASRQKLAELLAAWSLHVEWAEDGQTAVAKWQQASEQHRPFGLLIMAATLPDYAALLRQFRTAARGAVPTILLQPQAARPAKLRPPSPLRNAVYLRRPVTQAKLRRALRQASEPRAAPRTRKAASRVPAGPPSPAPPEVFNPADALVSAGGSMDRLRKGIEFYFREAPLLRAQIRAGLASRDASAIARAAHRLAGTLAYLGAKSSFEAARRVDELGLGGDLSGADAAIAALENELADLEQALLPCRVPGP